jgi:hypothetical protein
MGVRGMDNGRHEFGRGDKGNGVGLLEKSWGLGCALCLFARFLDRNGSRMRVLDVLNRDIQHFGGPLSNIRCYVAAVTLGGNGAAALRKQGTSWSKGTPNIVYE